jgi:D-alanine transaminase/branched-chain amino acid aminotransferase
VTPRIAYINGQFIEEEKACLHISDLAISRGYGVFDFFRTVNHVPLFIEDHLDRFFHSASGMRLKPGLTREELKSIIHHLIKTNNIPVSGIRILLTGGYSSDILEILAPNLIITQQPLSAPSSELFEKGIKVITHEYVRELPDVKTTHYIMGIWLHEKIKQHNAADVLYHQNGVVSEFPRSNFFIVTKDDVVVTPAKNILSGITRMKILELARKNFATEERTVSMENICNAKEAFMTSTTKRILPIVQIDDLIIGNGQPGQVTQKLDTAFVELEKEMIN